MYNSAGGDNARVVSVIKSPKNLLQQLHDLLVLPVTEQRPGAHEHNLIANYYEN